MAVLITPRLATPPAPTFMLVLAAPQTIWPGWIIPSLATDPHTGQCGRVRSGAAPLRSNLTSHTLVDQATAAGKSEVRQRWQAATRQSRRRRQPRQTLPAWLASAWAPKSSALWPDVLAHARQRMHTQLGPRLCEPSFPTMAKTTALRRSRC